MSGDTRIMRNELIDYGDWLLNGRISSCELESHRHRRHRDAGEGRGLSWAYAEMGRRHRGGRPRAGRHGAPTLLMLPVLRYIMFSYPREGGAQGRAAGL